MALTAAAADSRIKAVATASMYDMSRSMSRGHQDYYTREQRRKVVDHLSRQRWIDAENGAYARHPARPCSSPAPPRTPATTPRTSGPRPPTPSTW
ncbi:hypothetical protein [Actinoplanes sp. M2I2]|uniref:hypothetical protein n=1 Tax=Actinoplanes sp. M2I2 TaxID=1734444 RepID=UPI002020DD70|nr:hypothetical protein [Actinoplanes sp. M2I2]